MSAFRLVALAALALVTGCAPPGPPAAPLASPLLSSIKATAFGSDSVAFSLQVTNTGSAPLVVLSMPVARTASAPLVLEFGSGQEFDFVVSRGAQEVWRWSADRMFTQAMRTDTLDADETRTYGATWTPPPGSAGEYTVRGLLATRNVRVEQTMQFRL